MPLIRDYIAEHAKATDLGGEIVRRLDRGDSDGASELLGEFATHLAAHWQGEENGLFAAMIDDDIAGEHIRPLIAEHRQLETLLAGVDLADPVDQQRIREAVAELTVHISKEEDGIFPASLSALSGADWDAAMLAWQQAHPGRTLIGDAVPGHSSAADDDHDHGPNHHH